MKQTKKEFETLREARKFSRKISDEIAVESQIKSGKYIEPKKRRKNN